MKSPSKYQSIKKSQQSLHSRNQNESWYTNMPYLQRNQLCNYFKNYPQLRNTGFQICKKKMAKSLQLILKQVQVNKKLFINPCESRNKYVELYKWLSTRIQSIQQPQYYAQLSTLQYIEQQKKVIISGYLQLKDLISQQCKQKSQILRIILETSFQLTNTLLIQLQSMQSTMLLSYMQQKNKSQKQLIKQIQSLQKTIQILQKQKNNKYKNLYIVVKDNRIYKKQNHKLFKLLHSQQEKVQLLNQEIIKIKQDNQKFKLLLTISANHQQQSNKIAHYVQAKSQIDQIDKLIKLYPKKAQKIALKQLKNVQINQLPTLQEKIAHIIKAIQTSGQIFHDTEQFDDFLDTNKVKMSFNISTQTQVVLKQTATNTIDKISVTTSTQVPSSILSKTFKFIKLNVLEQILPTPTGIKRAQRKGKTVNLLGSDKSGINKSNRQIGSIKKLLLQDGDLCTGFQYTQTVNFRYPYQCSTKMINTKTTLLQRKDTISSNSDSEQNSNRQKRQNQQVKVRFQSSLNGRKNRDTVNSDIKNAENRMKINSRSRQKRISRVQNMHTFSSKQKMRDFRLIPDTDNWKTSKIYSLYTQQNTKICENVFTSTYEERNQKSKSFLPIFDQKRHLTNIGFKNLKLMKQEDSQSQSEINMIQEQNLAKNRNISEIISPEGFIKKFNSNRKQQILKENIYRSPNNIKINDLASPTKLIHKKQVSKDSFQIDSLKRQRKQSQQSLSSISTNSPFFQSRFLTQQQQQKSEIGVFRQISNKKSIKRISEFSGNKINLNSLQAKKFNRQASFVINTEKSASNRFGQKRGSQLSFHSFGNKKMKHNRTKTQGIQLIQQIAEQTFMTFKDIHDPSQNLKQIPLLNKVSQVQSQFQETFKPHKKFFMANLQNLEKIQNFNQAAQQEEASSLDLIKNIDKLIRNISQRSAQIIKKQYLFKDFLLSFYQLQYGGNNSQKTCTQFIKQMKKTKNSVNPTVQCLSLLMNENFSQVYRREIFKLFTVLIDKNGGSLTDYAGQHSFYKKIITQLLQIFINQTSAQQIIKSLCLQDLKGSLSDYFIAVEGQIRKRSLNSQLYSFLIQNIFQSSQTLVPFELIKQITYFLVQNNINLKNKLVELRMYSDPNIQLHRLCLIAARLNFKQFIQFGPQIEKKYKQCVRMTNEQFNSSLLINFLVKQKFDGFPCLKQILHKQIQCFYKYNTPISQPLLKLCQLTLFKQKIQNQFPLSDCLRIINQNSQKLDRLKHYKQVLQNTSK